MKRFLLIFFLLPTFFVSAQKIGEMAPEKPPGKFPPRAWGADLLFSDSGFGLGTFYRRTFSIKFSGFVDISFSEAKSAREFEFYDYWGRPIVIGKENRVFMVPITAVYNIAYLKKNLQTICVHISTVELVQYLQFQHPTKKSFSTPSNMQKYILALVAILDLVLILV